MKPTGSEQIAQERVDQILKHGHTTVSDIQKNPDKQLVNASSAILFKSKLCPEGWDDDKWQKLIEKPYPERLVIAGAFIAAEIDRVNRLEEMNDVEELKW